MNQFLSVCVVLLVAVPSTSAEENALLQSARENGALERLESRFPSVRVHSESEDAVAFYGAKMTAADTPARAADLWLLDHPDAFGVAGLDLRVTDSGKTGSGGNTVFSYQQFLNGLPVENAIGRILVENGTPNHVIYAAARLAQAPEQGFPERKVSATEALESVMRLREYAHLVTWSKPQLVVFYAEDDLRLPVATPTWKFSGSGESIDGASSFTFFVDAATASLLLARNEICAAQQVSGNLKGRVSPSPFPDSPSNLPAQQSLPSTRVRVPSTGTETYTDSRGNYTINVSGTTTIETELLGQWATVVDLTEPAPVTDPVRLTLSQTGTPGVPLNFLYAESNVQCNSTEFCTAQINAYLYTTRTHDFYKSLEADFTAIDFPIPCRVNNALPCGASFDPVNGWLQFSKEGSISGVFCRNFAYASVISHEYGHFVAFKLGINGSAFGEGFGDAMALLVYDTHLFGPDACGTGISIRDYSCANVSYPCSATYHAPCPTECVPHGLDHGCGRLLGDIWWDINTALKNKYGSGVGLTNTRSLFGSWSRISLGGFGGDSAHPLTAVEVLTVDDNDGNLCNGTPNIAEICAAFASHNIQCPVDSSGPTSGVTAKGLGSRYLRVIPKCPTDQAVALRVRGLPSDPCVSCVTKYVDGSGVLVSNPVYQLVNNWGTVNARGTEIVPTRTYLVDIVVGGVPLYSASATDTTWMWADVNFDYFVNAVDVLCVTDYFAGNPLLGCSLLVQNDLRPEATPDGFVNVDDTLAVLDAFAGIPFGGFQCSGCSGAAPGGASATEGLAPSPGAPTFQFVFQPRAAEAGSAENVLVDVFADGAQDVRAYQITFDVSGGVADGLRIEDIFIEKDRADYIFAGEEVEHAVTPGNRQMLNARYWGSVDRTQRAYLGTMVLRRLPGAAGTYHVGADLGIHTLVRNAQSGPISIAGTTNAAVTVT